MEGLMMKCGHIANSYKIVKDKKIPGCVICNCFEVTESKPSLEGRKARCRECGKLADSNWNLPFFRYGGKNKTDGLAWTDTYYCGCHGWD